MDEEEFVEFEGDDDRFGMKATIRNAEDVLRLVSADIHGNDDAVTEVFGRYPFQVLQDNPDLEDLLATSLSINSYFVEVLAHMTQTTPEKVIDDLLLDLI